MSEWILKGVEKETEPNCWHCGRHIKYVCWIEHVDTLQLMAVGRTCCQNFVKGPALRRMDSAISLEIDRLKLVSKAEKIVEKYQDREQIEIAKRFYNALNGNVPFMIKYFPELAALLGYKE